MTEKMKVAHIARESYVAACKKLGEQAYGLCGAKIEGADPPKDRDQCEVCTRIFETETGLDVRILEGPEGSTR